VIKKGDLLVITAPSMVTCGPQELPVIRVDDPIQILINNCNVSPMQMAWTEVSFSN
jgi:hypothetical protein